MTFFLGSALHLAAQKGFTDIVKLLIESGADVNAKNDYGLTPLHFSAIGKWLSLRNDFI